MRIGLKKCLEKKQRRVDQISNIAKLSCSRSARLGQRLFHDFRFIDENLDSLVRSLMLEDLLVKMSRQYFESGASNGKR